MNYLDNYYRWLESDAVDEDTKKNYGKSRGIRRKSRAGSLPCWSSVRRDCEA